MQLPQKYKENFEVSSFPTKGLNSKRRSSPWIFQVVASLYINQSFDLYEWINVALVYSKSIPGP
jgi:phage gp37-like protein